MDPGLWPDGAGRVDGCIPAERARTAIGGTLDPDGRGAVRVVGIVEDPRNITRLLFLALLSVGAVTGVLGFGACSPWLLERLEGVARRLPWRRALRYATRLARGHATGPS